MKDKIEMGYFDKKEDLREILENLEGKEITIFTGYGNYITPVKCYDDFVALLRPKVECPYDEVNLIAYIELNHVEMYQRQPKEMVVEKDDYDW